MNIDYSRKDEILKFLSDKYPEVTFAKVAFSSDNRYSPMEDDSGTVLCPVQALYRFYRRSNSFAGGITDIVIYIGEVKTPLCKSKLLNRIIVVWLIIESTPKTHIFP